MAQHDSGYPFSDVALARRLERGEGRFNASFVDARARAEPEVGAEWMEVAGAYCMFDGPGSPLTQTFGLGLFDVVGDGEIERTERFFAARGAEVFHEVSPMADPGLMALLGARGYRPVELTSVLYRPTAGDAGGDRADSRVTVRRIDASEAETWADTSARGWSEAAELADWIRGFALVTARAEGAACFLVELDGAPVATGAMGLYDGVALLAGASTVPEARRRGAQLALLRARLRYAAEQGCPLAMMGALPGSASQRNAERQGFRIACTRTKWHRVLSAT